MWSSPRFLQVQPRRVSFGLVVEAATRSMFNGLPPPRFCGECEGLCGQIARMSGRPPSARGGRRLISSGPSSYRLAPLAGAYPDVVWSIKSRTPTVYPDFGCTRGVEAPRFWGGRALSSGSALLHGWVPLLRGGADLFLSMVRSEWTSVSAGSIPVYAGNQQAARPGRLLEVFSGCRLRRERLFGGLSYSKQ